MASTKREHRWRKQEHLQLLLDTNADTYLDQGFQ